MADRATGAVGDDGPLNTGAMDETHLYVVIMAGGKGTRFWPASRESKPKQLLPIVGPEPMIRTTVDRMLPIVPAERIWVVTGASHAEDIRTLLPDIPVGNILVEPMGRNTAPCIGLAASVIKRNDPRAVLVVLPADHVIEKREQFLDICLKGAGLADRKDVLVTLGITPTYPETGYGYIEADLAGGGAHKVLKFHEKPGPAKAEEYLASGRFFWNSGMFIWKAETILDQISRFIPDLALGLDRLEKHMATPVLDEAINEIYPTLPTISIDFGVMEKSDRVMVIPADIGWSDVGSWTAAAGFWPKEEDSSVQGQAMFIDSSGCLVFSPNKLVTLIGVHDLVVVETEDALLICPRDRDQDVKLAVEALKEKNRKDLL